MSELAHTRGRVMGSQRGSARLAPQRTQNSVPTPRSFLIGSLARQDVMSAEEGQTSLDPLSLHPHSGFLSVYASPSLLDVMPLFAN